MLTKLHIVYDLYGSIPISCLRTVGQRPFSIVSYYVINVKSLSRSFCCDCETSVSALSVTHLAMMSPVHSATVTASLLAGEDTRREDTEPEVDMDIGWVDINTVTERQCFLYQG